MAFNNILRFFILLVILTRTLDVRAQVNSDGVTSIPVLTADRFDDKYEPTCLSNGFIGIRPGINPLEAAPVTVAGFTRALPELGNESLSQAPDPLAVNIELNGQAANLHTLKQSLDLRSGELTTDMEASTASGEKVSLKVVQFASRSLPCVLAESISIRATQDVQVMLTSRIAMNDAPVEVYRKGAYYQEEMWDDVLGIKTDRSKLGIAVVGKGEKVKRVHAGTFLGSAGAEKELRFQLLAAMVPDYYSLDPEQQACRMVQRAVMLGYDTLQAENRRNWEQLWRSRIRVTGDAEAQQALDVAFYYLHSEAHPSSQLSVPAFGLTAPTNYFGHIFWDADSWMFLPIVLTDPAAGRQMVNFRRRTLEAAQKIASLYGTQGAQYPWETSQSGGGKEDCPNAANTGWSEQHIVNDIAIAQWEYYLATGDEVYLREGAWPVLREIANWICSRGIWTDKGFEILKICGVDEDTPDIDNGAHMNLTAKMALKAAMDCARKLGYTEPKEWRTTADNMYVPMDNTGKVIIPYPRAKHKPGHVGYSVGMLPFLMVHNPPVSMKIFRDTWDLEEKIRKEQPAAPGNPASSGANGYGSIPMAAAAAFFGQRETANEIFHNSWKPYWRGAFGMMAEYRKNSFGGFITTYGSFLQSTLLGFTGLRIVDGDWRMYPATLPAGWTRIECDQIWVKGKPMKLVAEQGKLASLTPAKTH